MKVFDFIPEGVENCVVSAWIHTEGTSPEIEKRQWPSIIICPGGGYWMVSDREAEPVAQAYFMEGFNTFILRYSVRENAKDFIPLCQLAATVAHVRKHAEEWCADEEKIAVFGASAGGHLACSLGTLFNAEQFKKAFGREENVRPNAMVLIYPVITADEYAHRDSIQSVSGSKVGSDRYQWFGLDKHVDEQTPPTFLYHTAEDQCVPVQNSLRFAEALADKNVPYELHILPKGGHAMSVCTETVGSRNDYNARWVKWSIMWLNELFGTHI